ASTPPRAPPAGLTTEPSPTTPPPVATETAPAPTAPAPTAPAPTAPPPTAPPEGHRRAIQTSAAIATAVLGGAALVCAVATGTLALRRRADYDDGCDRGNCNQGRFDAAWHFAVATDVLVPVGVALAATSLVLFLTRPRTPPRLSFRF